MRKIFFSALVFIPFCVYSQTSPQEPLELPVEIIVTDRSIRDIRIDIESARVNIYELFNKLNDEDEFDIHCYYERVTGSLIKKHLGRANFVGNALTTAASTAFVGINSNFRARTFSDPGQGNSINFSNSNLIQGEISSKNTILKNKMLEIVNSNQELINEVFKLENLMEEYKGITCKGLEC